MALRPFWHPQPFQGDPAWVESEPELTAALLAVSEEALAQFHADPAQLRHWLAARWPPFAPLQSMSAAWQPAANRPPPPPLSPHLWRDIPGRKQAQIEALRAQLDPIHHPIVEWCGGKGHLGRILAVHHQQPVVTLEQNPTLCQAGAELAAAAQIDQQLYAVDVLTDPFPLSHHHTVALHACGELHRHLLRRVVADRAPALDLVPCCYHLGGAWQPFRAASPLQLTPADCRLIVTETATAAPREVALRNRDMAWKLAFQQLWRDQTGITRYHPLAPIPKGWLRLPFTDFCGRLSQREGLPLPSSLPFTRYEAHGWQQQQRVMRLSLIRLACGRPLEIALLTDMGLWLTESGYRVEITPFCPHTLTPRNLLLSARL